MKKNFYLSFLFFASILLVPLSFSNEIFLNNDKRSSDNQISENPSAKHAVDQEDPFFEIDNVESSKTSITYDFSLNLGNDGTTEDKYHPALIKRFNNISKFSLGLGHSAIVEENKDLYMWGDNGFGQLGDGSTKAKHTPTLIMQLSLI